MVYHWSLTGNKSHQVSRTLLRILANLNNAVVWMVPSCLVISKSSSPCTNHSVIVQRAPITIGIIVTFMFHRFFNSLAKSRYLSFFSHSFNYTLWYAGTAKSTIMQVLYFLLIIIRSGRLAKIRIIIIKKDLLFETIYLCTNYWCKIEKLETIWSLSKYTDSKLNNPTKFNMP